MVGDGGSDNYLLLRPSPRRKESGLLMLEAIFGLVTSLIGIMCWTLYKLGRIDRRTNDMSHQIKELKGAWEKWLDDSGRR